MYERDPHYWAAHLSITAGMALKNLERKDPDIARRHLRATLREFERSPIPGPELRDKLREYLR